MAVGAESRLDKVPQAVFIGRIIAYSLLELAVMFAAIAFISLRTGANKLDWGWSPKHLGEDIDTGVMAFAMLVPPVLVLQAALVYVFQWKSEHPLLENLKSSPSLTLYGASLIAAVVVAPLAEEWAFRVLLQGWMEKVATGRFNWEQLLIGGSTGELVEEPEHRPAIRAETETMEEANPSATDSESSPHSPTEMSQHETARSTSPAVDLKAPWWPTVVSAALFAVVHISHGPDFLPLFFLALGLGYLYRQTHRIVPSMVVHFCLNSLTMLGMGAELLSGP